MNAIFLKIMLIVKTILAALGVGGCLGSRDIDTLEEVVDDIIIIENEIENDFK